MADAVSADVASVQSPIGTLVEREAAALDRAACLVAATIANYGIVHVFGRGHSSLLAQEVFHRAGGLMPVNTLLDVNLTIFGSARATIVERLKGYAQSIVASYDIRPGEVVILISTPGVNSVPIEFAQLARDRGATTVAVMPAAAYADTPSSHGQDLRLANNVLIVAAADRLDRDGHPVPVVTSQNMPGGDEHNRDPIDRYRQRIPLMKP